MSVTPEYAEIQNDVNWVKGMEEIPWRRSEYGGLVLSGACPVCRHHEGIKSFVATTWATGDDGSSAPAPAAGAKTLLLYQSVYVPAKARPDALERVTVAAPIEIVLCRCSESHENTPTGKSGCGRWVRRC